MTTWLIDFKFAYPGRYKALYATIVFGLVFVALMLIPDTQFTRAIGAISLQNRVAAFRHAIYWEVRVQSNPYIQVEHTVKYGFVVGLSPDEKLIVSVPFDDAYMRYEYRLADVQIKNASAVHTYIKMHKAVSARFDIYDDMVVAYLDGVPLNLQIIENGIATPDPNPPSNIVDAAFATYYWSVVRGKYTKD